jgi:hypothetical protein
MIGFFCLFLWDLGFFVSEELAASIVRVDFTTPSILKAEAAN